MPQMARSFQWYFDGLLYGLGSEGSSWTRLWREGSEGSEGSACLWQAGSKGCGLPLRAMLIKSALRDWLYGSYSLIRILLTGSLRSPPLSELRRTFSTGKRVTRFSGRFASLRIVFPCHPCSGGRIDFYASYRDMAPLLSTHSPTAPRGEGGAVRHQRGNAFSSPAGRLYGFSRQRRHKKWRRRRRTSPVERYFIPPEGGALNPPVRRSRSQAEPWQPRAERPGGWLNPHARKGVSTFGNTGSLRITEGGIGGE